MSTSLARIFFLLSEPRFFPFHSPAFPSPFRSSECQIPVQFSLSSPRHFTKESPPMPESPLSIIHGACSHDCPDTCSWFVEVKNQQATRLTANPDHPFTQGTLCTKVNHYLEERVYHPDRILYPLRRVGAKGQGEFQRVSWDEALTEIAGRWQEISSNWGAEAILPFSSAGNQGLIQTASLDQRLFGFLGCSQLDRSICGAVAGAGISATQGCGFGINPEDIVHSRYIILWGTNTIVTNLHLWPFILEARARGAKIVCIDPVRTRTAEASDWHIPIRPGSDGALALAMMHVIIRDGFADLDYVQQYAEGFDQLAAHVQQFSPEAVASVTGLSPATIEQLALEYATTVPSLVRPLIGIEHHHNGAMMFRTISCLPILIGAWRHRGGGLSRSTHSFQYSALNMQAVLPPSVCQSSARTLNMRDLGDILCSTTLSPPVQMLVVWNSNPASTLPNQHKVQAGLRRSDLLTVVHDLFLTDTARYADFVLPATSQIELLDLVPAWGHHYLSLNLPAIPPRGEAVSNTEFFRRLAGALGRTEPFLFESDEELLRAALNSNSSLLEGITYERLVQDGFAKLNVPDDWRPFANGGFHTPSGKALLYSAELAAMGISPLPVPGTIRESRQFGLQLISGKSLHFMNSSYSHVERHRKRAGLLELDIHPSDAHRRNLKSGDKVRVFNEGGTVIAVCRVSDRVQPGIVSMPFGSLSDAAGNPTNVNVLTPEEPTDWAGGSGFYDAFVEVEAVAA